MLIIPFRERKRGGKEFLSARPRIFVRDFLSVARADAYREERKLRGKKAIIVPDGNCKSSTYLSTFTEIRFPNTILHIYTRIRGASSKQMRY